MAQAIYNTPAPKLAVTPERPSGQALRPVATASTTHLVYEYETPGGAARLSIDPSDVVNDIERVRKRQSKKLKAKNAVLTTPAAPKQEEALVEHAPLPAPVSAAAPAPSQQERKVRVIPLYNQPSQN